jgi:hypothetical protein
MEKSAQADMFEGVTGLDEAQAVLVLGARVYESGRLSDVFRDRVDTALEVYNAGKADKILISGDHGRQDYDEVNAAKDYLLEKGVPGEDLFTDHAGFDTFDSLYRARDVFQAESLVISTQAFHLPRALYIARELDLPAQGIIADKHKYLGEARNELREHPARVKAWLDIQLGAQPEFLGEAIPISGNGQASWDTGKAGAFREVLVEDGFAASLVEAALARTKEKIAYDPAYFEIAYPDGDIPPDKGVCTDVIIRSYRALGIDLQKEVHTDMAADFSAYPNRWGLDRPDTNIDHRRVPNLMAFFERKNASLPVSESAEDYLPGDIVIWDLGRGKTHIGIVSNFVKNGRPLIVHNIGAGPKLEDVLFGYEIIGHYQYPTRLN